MSRQRLILTLVVGLLLLALGYAYWATPRQQKVAAKAVAKGEPATGGAAAVATTAPRGTLRLDLLEREAEEGSGFKRDLFSLRKPAPPAPPKPPALPQAPVRPLQPQPTSGVPEAGAISRALGQFTFLGFLQKNGEKTLFLSSQGEIFVVKKGTAFGKQKEFIISEVGAETLTIRQAHGPGSMTVSLVEQRPLTPVSAPSQLPRAQGPGLPPMTIQPLPEDLARQAAEGGGVEEPAPVAEQAPEQGEEVPGDMPQPILFGPQRPAPTLQQPASTIPPGAPSPQGLQFPGMN